MPDNNNTEDYILLIKAELDESVRTALNGFKVASDQLTAEAKQIQQSIKEVGENGGEGIKDVEQEVKRLTAATRQLGNPLNTVARGAKETKSSMDQWIASLNRAEQELREIPTRVTFLNNELKKLKLNAKDNAAIINLYSNELNKLQAAQLGSAAATQNSGKGMARFRQLAQNTAYQVTDFGVSIQNGTRASVAFTQQVPQVLGAFGAVGAVLGLAATGLGIFAGKYIDELQKSLSPTAAIKRATKELDETLQGIGETFKKIDLSNYIDQLKEADKFQTKIAEEAVTNSLEKSLEANEGKIKALTNLVKGEANTLASEYKTITDSIFGRDAGISQLVLGLKISGKEAQALLDIMSGIDIESNSAFLIKNLDQSNPKFKALRERLVEINTALQQQSDIQNNIEQVRKLGQENRINNANLLFQLAIKEANEDAKKLIAQDKLNQSYDEYLKENYKKLGLDDEQLKKLLKIKDENKEIAKIVKETTSNYQKLVESNETATEERDRELKSLKELKATLDRLKASGDIDFAPDPEAFERARDAINEAFQERRLKEFKEGLSEADRIFYDMNEKAVKTASTLSELANVRENGTFEEYAALVKHLGDAAPLADRLKVAMIEMQEQGKEQEEINRLIAEMAEQYDLTEKQVKDLQKAMGIAAKDMKKELTEMQKLLNDIAEKSVGHMTDAFIEFAKTGKTNFKDLINAILEDTARLFVSQQFRQLFTDIGLITTTDGGGAGASGGEGNSSFFTKGFNYLKGLGSELFSGGTQKNVPLTNAFTSAATNTAGNVAVNVINNSSNQTTTRQSRSSDGSSVDVIIENAVDKAFANGRFDNTFSGQYGLQRRGT